MIEPGALATAVPNVGRITAEAAKWLERFNSGNWSEHDQAQLDIWLAKSYANRVAYLRLEAAWSLATRVAALQPKSQNVADRSSVLLQAFKIAASVFVMAVLGIAAANFLLPQSTQTYTTSLGSRKTVSLADGSRIELNTDTKLRIATSSAGRKVWLDRGEAYFEVNHSAAIPFVVDVGAQRVTDLGTKFLVKRNDDSVEVALVEGRAQIASSAHDVSVHLAILSPGDVAVAANGSFSVTRRPSETLKNALAWRRGLLVFQETPLGDAAAEFNRYNLRKLVVADPDAARMKINGSFPVNGSDSFLRIAQHILRLHVAIRGDCTVISR